MPHLRSENPTLALVRMALVLLLAGGAKAQFTAAPGSPFNVGTNPQSVAVGDFNGDGKPDLATANWGGNSVTVLLGNGSGGFTAAAGSPFAVGTTPQSVAVGDFNGDGRPDLVTANSGDNTITVLLGSGSGKFTAAPGSPFTVGSSPVFVAVGDFNGDGRADIATANSGDNTITVLLGDGGGGFSAAPGSPVAVGSSPKAIAVGDVNADGRQDLAVANGAGRSVTVLLGNGTGGFMAAPNSPFAVGSSPVSVVLRDLNRDGKPDIVTANAGDNTLTELLGDGSGGFTVSAGSPISVGVQPSSVAVADFNGDGAPDLVSANSGDNTITVLLGNGAGGFTAAAGSPFTAGIDPTCAAVADFTGDGRPGIAVTNAYDGTVAVYLNSLNAMVVNPASLTFYAGVGQASAETIPVSISALVGGSTYAVSSNEPWLVPTPATGMTGSVSTVKVAANPGSMAAGVYSGIVRYAAPDFFDAATAVTISLAAPSGTLQLASGSPFPAGASPQSLAVGDFNGDGNPDVVTANYAGNNVTVLLGNGAGGFTAAPGSPFAVGLNPASVAVADFNRDGNADIVTANSGGNSVTVLLGNGAGGFTPAGGSPYAVGTDPLSVAVADVNGDGKPDLITANNGDEDLTILLGNGTGGFTPAQGSPYPLGSFPLFVASADFNGDGKADLVTADFNDDRVTVLLGNGAGGFTVAAGSPFSVGSFPQAVATGDLNGDGRPDIATANYGSNSVSVLLATASGGFTAAPGSPYPVGRGPQSVTIADMNGDGKPDIVAANVQENTVTVLIGNGSGGFSPASANPFAAGAAPYSVAAADFNGDGRPDLAAADTAGGTVTVLLGGTTSTNSVLSTTAASPVAGGTSVPLTLTVTGGLGPPTGTATFLDGGTAIGTSAQTASPFTFAATSLAIGVHTLTATYSGDSASGSSASTSLSVTIAGAAQTIAFGSIPSKALGIPAFTLTATASSGLAVVFASTTSSVCTVSGSMVTLVSVGTCTVQASQPGDIAYRAATPVNQSFQVTQGSQTITFASLPNLAAGSAPFTLSATASSGLPVSFASTSSGVCTVSGTTVTLVSVGTCTIQATQPGNTDYSAAAPVSQHFSVAAAGQTITFGALMSQALGSASFLVSATASSGLAVSFSSTTSPVCGVSGATVTLVSVGTCTIQASQAGNGSYGAAPNVSQSFMVTQGSQTISFSALASQPLGSAPFMLSAYASSGLPVSFASTTSAVCKVSSANVTLVSVGTCDIEASQAGNKNYSAATPVDQSFTVTQGTQTITFGALMNVAFGGAPVMLTATASSGLAVSFTSLTAAVCSVSGASVTLVSAGACSIQASQGGNSNYGAATPVDQNFTVTQGTQTITFGALMNVAFGGAPVMLTATASSGLPVVYASTTAPVCTVSGTMVTLATGGKCTIQATQPGNTDYAAAPSVSQSFLVTAESQTITFGPLIGQTVGATPFTVSATASSGLPVTFTSTTMSVCTISASTVTVAGAGKCTIQASQAGNSTYAAAPSVSQSFIVAGESQTITFTTVLTQTFGASPFALSAIASSGLAVTFTSSTMSVCTVSTATVTLVSGGTCTIQATQAGNSTYAAAPPVSQSFMVTPASQYITFGSLMNKTFGAAAPFTVSATASSGLAVVFTSTTTPVCTVSGTSVTLAGAGTCTIQAAQPGNASYGAATPVDESFMVAQGTQTITFAAISTKSFVPTPITLTATASSGLTVSYASTTAPVCTVSGMSVTLVSLGTCTIQASQPGNANYAAALSVTQSFMVTQGSQTITFAAIATTPFAPGPMALNATASSGLAVTYATTTSSVCALSSAGVTLVSLGTCTIQASQPGNANYAAAPSVSQSFMVTQGNQTITFAALPSEPFGVPLMVSATASSGLAVALTSTTSSVCTVSGTTATMVSLGTCTLEADQAGNTNYAAAPSVTRSFTVVQGSQTIAFAALPSQPAGAAPFTLSATASSGLAVSFASNTTPVCTVNGTTVTLLTVGTCTIQATQAGNADYAAATPVSQTFMVGVPVTVAAVLNAASYATLPIAANGYTVAFGSNFSTMAAQTTSVMLPSTLANATVSVTDSNGLTLPSPLFYVSPTQINFLVPAGLAAGSASVVVTGSDGLTGSFTTTVASVSPGLFTADATGHGVPAALAIAYDSAGDAQVEPVYNCGGSPVVCDPVPINLGPASTSVYLSLYGTGIRGRSSLAGVSATLGGTALQLFYAGAQGTYPGLDQVNVLLDRSLIGQGQLVLQLTVDGVAANPVVVDIM